MLLTLEYFKLSEFDCKHTGENEMNEDFLRDINELRDACGFPFIITSGYRSPDHPIEAAKAVPGVHTAGIAADIFVSGGYQRYKLVKEAIKMGFGGIGIAKTFVHVDDRSHSAGAPVMWVYGG